MAAIAASRHVRLVRIDAVSPRKPLQTAIVMLQPLVNLPEYPHRSPVLGVDLDHLLEKRNGILQAPAAVVVKRTGLLAVEQDQALGQDSACS